MDTNNKVNISSISMKNSNIRGLTLSIYVNLDNDFSEYSNVLNLIRLNFPDGIYGNANGKVKTGMWCSQDPKTQKEVVETIYAKSSNMRLKIYNKVQQLIDTNKLFEDQPANIMCIEYEITDYEKIDRDFGSCTIDVLTDEAMKKWFWKCFARDIANPWKYWHRANQERLAEALKYHISSRNRYYLSNFVNECREYAGLNMYPLLFDIEDIYQALKIAKGGKGLKKTFERFKDKLNYMSDLTGNIAKIEEIIDKVVNICCHDTN